LGINWVVVVIVAGSCQLLIVYEELPKDTSTSISSNSLMYKVEARNISNVVCLAAWFLIL
jgi:hypothetical protein